MSYIKVIRLKPNEDIIAFVERGEDTIKLIHPISFYIDYDTHEMKQSLVLKYWLPINMIADNSVIISLYDVLFITDPKQSFKEYYLNFLNKEEIISNIDRTIIKGILDTMDIDTIH